MKQPNKELVPAELHKQLFVACHCCEDKTCTCWIRPQGHNVDVDHVKAVMALWMLSHEINPEGPTRNWSIFLQWGAGHLGGPASLLPILSPCMSFFFLPILFSLSHCFLVFLLLSLIYTSTFLCLVQIANCIIPRLKKVQKNVQQCFFLCFSFPLFPRVGLSLCYRASYSLFEYAIERHVRSSKTISKPINNCQVRGKAERAQPL